ncbi:HelD family protein [Actinocatenispora rupis]|uniref:DNA helicase n=1 Tax=Actinocatenispora rupis TaxID=519421 RepID=A0A8J3NFH2_9ACTN|nr:UvrD-helicase domain-containing protein [Actinocatenispora rupis]GID15292.1 DNA helicase [Actinocatenispora rupis]
MADGGAGQVLRAGVGELGEVEREQAYVTRLYAKLDAMRATAGEHLAEALRASGGTPGARSERESVVSRAREQVAGLDAVEQGLCFGRLDFTDDTAQGTGPERQAEGPRYVGRIGIFDEDDDYEPLLVDWRAPAARAFYLATAASPQGVRRRRHITTRGRTVVGVSDEVLDLDEADGAPNRDGLTGEATLLAALTRSRTGRMRDIVDTIQAEQDRVIRSDLAGVLVVQGGPGTGKTAVALHRAAYLLYTYREQLSRQGVLLVGPHATFLAYIGHVLPALAETGVLPRTVGQLYPGIDARRAESAATGEVKGSLAMVDVVRAAVADRQRVPDGPVEVEIADTHAGFGFQRDTVVLEPEVIERARDRARRTTRPHNLARPVFVAEVVDALGWQVAQRLGADPYADQALGGNDAPGEGALLLDEADVAEIRRELATDQALLAALDDLWPVLTPQRLLADLYASDERMAAAGLDADRIALLRRPAGSGWAPADVPLLDEAAELLGEDDSARQARLERARRRQIAYAQGVLDITAGSASQEFEDEESEILEVGDLLDASHLADRQEYAEHLTAAERAAADREWTFGHVIVDEAQDLSPMAWRLLMRRCPTRSMTVVGDVAQTGDLSGTGAWSDVFDRYAADRWRLTELRTSYRTPAEILSVAARLLTHIDPSLAAPLAVRETGVPPAIVAAAPDGLADSVIETVRAAVAEVGDGRVGVIVPAGSAGTLGGTVAAAVPGAAFGDDPDLERTVAVLTARQAKGLEFDTVVVVEPGSIVAESPRGHSDLYVALTRTTNTLTIVHSGHLPVELATA